MTRPKTAPVAKKLVSVGKYRLTGKLLGKGNFARVEEAVHMLLKTKVALKVMDTSQIKEDYVVRNLEREARIMSNLSHPCIAALFETMQCGTVYYLVTELAEGGDMCSHIKAQKTGRLDERSARNYARQLVSAIGHMHSKGIVHRDLKMENIMIAANRSQIKIVDFGLSNIWSPDCPLRTHCGSPEYAAPELFLVGRNYGPEVDLWSLGVILYGMVTGRLPFVTSRDENQSSQERRQKLLCQINRGLTLNHRKELSSMSTEFKNLISKLLVPSSQGRLNTESLLYHPWITQKNKKLIKVNPMGKNDSFWQSNTLQEIGNMVELDPYTVNYEINSNRFNAIGGMYNIQEHNELLRNLPNDAITYERPLTPIKHIPGPFKANYRGINQSSQYVSKEKLKCNSSKTTSETSKTESEFKMGYGNNTIVLNPESPSYTSGLSTVLRNKVKSAPVKRSIITTSGGDASFSSTKTNITNPNPIRKSGGRSYPNGEGDDERRPSARCPLHTSHLALPNHSRVLPTGSSPTKLQIYGTRGLRRPFNQRPATVHPQIKPQTLPPSEMDLQKKRLIHTKNRIKSDPAPVQTASRPLLLTNGYRAHLPRGDKHIILNKTNQSSTVPKLYNKVVERKISGGFKMTDKTSTSSSNDVSSQDRGSERSLKIKRKENPIARSIAGYVKAIRSDPKSNRTLRLRHMMERAKNLPKN